MTKILLELQQLPQSYLKLVVSGNAMLGSATSMEWAVPERQMPSEFASLEKVVQVEGDPFISRNHAGVLFDIAKKKFVLIDLNSKNGTIINGKVITRETLSKGDIISLGATMFLVDFKSADSNHHAILVSHDGGNLRGTQEDVNQLSDRIYKRGFGDNVIKLYNPNKLQIITALNNLAFVTTSTSHVIFSYSGHGSPNGLEVGLDTISPKELLDKLDNVNGKKAVIIDACHAGTFVCEYLKRSIPAMLVIAACRTDERAHERLSTSISSGKYMGIFTSTLIKYLDKHPGSFDLADIQHEFEKSLSKNEYLCGGIQTPSISGQRFSIIKVMSEYQKD